MTGNRVDRTSALGPIFVCVRTETPRTRLDVGGIAVAMHAFTRSKFKLKSLTPFDFL